MYVFGMYYIYSCIQGEFSDMYPTFGDMYVCVFSPLSLANNCDWLYLGSYTEKYTD